MNDAMTTMIMTMALIALAEETARDSMGPDATEDEVGELMYKLCDRARETAAKRFYEEVSPSEAVNRCKALMRAQIEKERAEEG